MMGFLKYFLALSSCVLGYLEAAAANKSNAGGKYTNFH